MDKIRITGGVPLRGRIHVGGAKNAALPLMAASLLTREAVTLSNVPYLADVTTMAKLLCQHGVELMMKDENLGEPISTGSMRDSTSREPSASEASPIAEVSRPEQGHQKNSSRTPYSREITLQADAITNFTAPYDMVRTMRASVLVLGPLVARFGQARVSLPGGCAIGTRPIDLHLKALEQLGAHIELEDGYVVARVAGRLQGADITFEKVSVGATENILMAAALAEGTTILRNAAREPEIGDLAKLLNSMGAQIEGIGSDTLTIRGVAELHGARHRVLPDRIETGTFLIAGAITKGDLELVGAEAETSGALIDVLKQVGVTVEETAEGLRVRRTNCNLGGAVITTEPYPAFPTDMQAQIMTLLAVAQGKSDISETIFENRFMHVPELMRMGAHITVEGHTAHIEGVPSLRGAEVMATDLRASVSLALAALVAEGETTIHRIYHLDRGYERLEEKLQACGARIERVK